MSFNITPVASGYQEIHPYSAMNIDSVKINTSLTMMREWQIQKTWQDWYKRETYYWQDQAQQTADRPKGFNWDGKDLIW